MTEGVYDATKGQPDTFVMGDRPIWVVTTLKIKFVNKSALDELKTCIAEAEKVAAETGGACAVLTLPGEFEAQPKHAVAVAVNRLRKRLVEGFTQDLPEEIEHLLQAVEAAGRGPHEPEIGLSREQDMQLDSLIGELASWYESLVSRSDGLSKGDGYIAIRFEGQPGANAHGSPACVTVRTEAVVQGTRTR